tara:strand:- start:1481 stop:1846 length:366 start_codon:yes stop_codon:yes gene_type:complete
MDDQLNVLGGKLQPCSTNPLTGYFRDGHCKTCHEDSGIHSVCAVMTKEFLDFSKENGNDLKTPQPLAQFPGLRPGDKWCLCAARWIEAHKNGVAPQVVLESTHEETLVMVSLEVLETYKSS